MTRALAYSIAALLCLVASVAALTHARDEASRVIGEAKWKRRKGAFS